MKKYFAALGLGLSIVAMAVDATAATRSRTFNTRVRIVKSCRISATPVNFGNLSTVLGTETATSTVSVICNVGTTYRLSFTAAAGTLTKTSNLVNGANTIRANFSLGTAAAAAGTGSGTKSIMVGLAAKPFPVPGLYQVTQTVYIVY
ncbi:MAG: spore coat protein U domain-containing protein [Alphaproteobacteria bacterium]|nr:spore coat protein U domain-containing protein [Alphaproteobacteria bacterium]